MSRKILLIGASRITAELIMEIAAQYPGIIIISGVKQAYKSPFESESIPFHNLKDDSFDTWTDKHKFYENEPSKFIGKPKNNFKKR